MLNTRSHKYRPQHNGDGSFDVLSQSLPLLRRCGHRSARSACLTLIPRGSINIIDDSLEESLGLLSALKEMSGMVPPPSTMDWSLSNTHSLFNIDHNVDMRDSLHKELIDSVVSSTPRNTNKDHLHSNDHSPFPIKHRLRTYSLQRTPLENGDCEEDEYDYDDNEELQPERSTEQVIKDLQKRIR